VWGIQVVVCSFFYLGNTWGPKTGKALIIYKCNKVSQRYLKDISKISQRILKEFSKISQRNLRAPSPLKLRGFHMNFPIYNFLIIYEINIK
jgi:hypothetical protein